MLNEYCVIGGEQVSFTYGSCQQEIDLLNRVFFEVMLEGDSDGKLFAYPIPTYNIHKRFDWDNPNNKLLWEMAGKYGTPYFANFVNSDLDISDVRSMCPLSGDTEILAYNDREKTYYISPIKELYNNHKKDDRKTSVKVLSNGREIECVVNKFDIPANYTIRLVNGAEIKTTANHLNKVLGKDYVETKDLTEEDYLPISLIPFEKTKNLTYEQGLLVGMFLGDGSYSDPNSIVYSLNRDKKAGLIDFVYDYATKFYAANVSECELTSDISGKNSCVNVRVTSKSLYNFITTFVSGTNALTKGINPAAYAQSIEFRKGILDGLYQTDGGNRNRIYTASAGLRDSIVTLCATLGIATTLDCDERDGRLGTNPVYTVRYYEPNRSKFGDFYKIDGDYIYFRVESVTKDEECKSRCSYCMEVLDDDIEPVFMLANGVVTHNCRLRLDLSELRHRNGGLFGAGDSTGSIGVVTLNLPRIGYESKGSEEAFFANLDHYLDIAKDSLEIKRDWLQKNVIDTRLIPAYMEYVGTINNHFSTIGVLGYNELCENFMGKNILDNDAHEFCVRVGDHIREKLLEYQSETGHLYNYEATPAESTCYRLALLDKKKYPDIITQGTGNDIYYTNSCHIPVKLIKSIDDTFKHQNDLQKQFTGGTVIHCYLEGAISGEQAKSIVKSMFDKYEVPYMSLSPISRYCDEHGYIKEHVTKCPICKKKLKMYQRITGYLRCIDNFNKGKAAEFKDRAQLSGDE